MRPLRALASVFALVLVWIVWRIPAIHEDFLELTRPRVEALPPLAKAKAASVPQIVRSAAVEPPPVVAALPLPAIRVERIEVAAISAPAASIAAKPEPAPPQESGRPELLPTPREEPAALGYRLLADGDRRGAAQAFRRALKGDPTDPRAAAWGTQLAALERRWSGSAYVFVRESGGGALAATPVLGGGQSGAQINYSLDPLSRQPLAIVGRITAPNAGLRPGAQAALGLTWRPTPTISLSGERLFGLGNQARSAWTVRAAGGAATTQGSRSAWLDASVYGEAGVVGVKNTATYGAVQARAGRARALPGGLIASAGTGVWASIQHDQRTVSRLEIGPTARVRYGALEAAVDYRWRVTGNAAPGSGPALTLAAYF